VDKALGTSCVSAESWAYSLWSRAEKVSPASRYGVFPGIDKDYDTRDRATLE